MNHEEFEKKAMDMLLEGSDPKLVILKTQYASATVIKRDFTGVGFFTRFNVPDTLVVEHFKGRIDDVRARIKNDEGNWTLGDWLFFILYIRDGKICTLECFTTLDDIWDYNYDNANPLEYCFDGRRDYILS